MKLQNIVEEKIGRNEQPSACIVDSQSVKTTEKGGSKAMMEVKK